MSIGQQLFEWCSKGLTVEVVREKIKKAESIQDLTELYKEYRAYFPVLQEEFQGRKAALNEILVHPI